jgi:hypothetical protein
MWDYDWTPQTRDEQLFERFLNHLWNRSDLSKRFSRLVALQSYLETNLPTTSEELYQDIHRGNGPMFTRAQAHHVWNTIRKQKGLTKEEDGQTGGALLDDVGGMIYESMRPFAPSVFNGMDTVYSFATLPFTVLNEIKNSTPFGPFMDWGISGYSKLLPKLLSAIEPYMEALTVATAGAGGVVFIGQAIAAINSALLHMLINEPVSAYIALLTAMPIVGPPIVTLVHQIETSYEDLKKQRRRIADSIFGDIFETYIGQPYMDRLEKMEFERQS